MHTGLREIAPGLLFHLVWVLPCLLIVSWFFSQQFQGLYIIDAVDAAQVGRHLSRGDGFVTSFIRPLSLAIVPKVAGHPDLQNAPLYPLMLAIAFNLLGAADRTVALVSSLFVLLTSCMAYLLANRLAGRWAGVFAALLVSLSMALLKAGVAGIGVPMLAFLIALLFYLVAVHRGTLRWSMLCGIVCGLAYLTDFAVLLVAVPGAVLVAQAGHTTRLRHAAAFLIGFALLMGPWAARNWVVTGSPVVSTRWYSIAGSGPENPGTSLYRVPDPARVSPVHFIARNSREVAKKILKGLGAFEGVVGGDFGVYLWGLLALALFMDLGLVGNRLKWGMVAGGFLLAISVVTGIPRFEAFYGFIGVAASLGAAAFAVVMRQRGLPRSSVIAAVTAVLALAAYPVALMALPGSQPPKPDHRNLEYLGRSLPANAVVVTDQPWGVAWYADRIAVWLPEAPVPSGQTQNMKLKAVADATRSKGFESAANAGVKADAIFLSSDLRSYPPGERLGRWQLLWEVIGAQLHPSQQAKKAQPIWVPPGWELAATLPPEDFLLLRLKDTSQSDQAAPRSRR
jgi:hypothetical protein